MPSAERRSQLEARHRKRILFASLINDALSCLFAVFQRVLLLLPATRDVFQQV